MNSESGGIAIADEATANRLIILISLISLISLLILHITIHISNYGCIRTRCHN